MQQVDSSGEKIKELEDRINYREHYSRRKNLRISGMEKGNNETWEQTMAAITSLLHYVLSVSQKVGLLCKCSRVYSSDDVVKNCFYSFINQSVKQ